MLKKHMLKRIKELGGLNPLSARIVSLEKWETIDQFIRIQEEHSSFGTLKFKRGHGIYSNTCGMCRLYYWRSSCSMKCLFNRGPGECNTTTSLWSQAQDAVNNGDLEAFKRAQAKIVSSLKRSITQMQKTKQEDQ